VNIINVSKVFVRRTSDGKYLVLRSGAWEERPDRSQKPDFAGGVVEPGERIEQGAARELLEETGLDVQPADLTLVYTTSFLSDKDGAAVNRLVYFVEIEGEPEVTLSWEHEEFWWATADELRALDIRAPYPAIIRHLDDIGLLS